ncbi:hypothetical protein MSG28_008571 [Choristoneura fumiferana]|uniref:Uncharacterized protein n=1 Tax=Choristoneura fumiferana TaxID=7141 RepID=A0ACC0J788_CHOFU|nr:hypothetical protein MSG28_008571 [Choristoneura fumiferana]
MSLLPTLWPARLNDQSFGMCITPDDIIFPFYNANTNYYRPWKWCMQNVVDFGSKVDNQTDYFKVTLDVQHFRPNEISVKVVNDQILVEGRHKERKDEHGLIARQFTRRYALPHNCKSEDVTSNLSSDGILTVTAKKKSGDELKKKEKVIPIKLCKSCPMMEQVRNKNETCNIQKDINYEIGKVDTVKKNTQIMLKEDHCCLLLKPEILKEATSESSEIKTEKKKENEETEKVKAVEQTSRNTSEILEETLSKSRTVAAAAAGISEQMLIDKTSTAISTSTETMEQTCAKSAAAVTTSSKEIGQTCMATSQMSELATSSKASASMESSSYKSSMTSSVKEISDDLSDFVNDILCYELETTEDTK